MRRTSCYDSAVTALPVIAITHSTHVGAARYAASIERRGAKVRLVAPEEHADPTRALSGVSGLVLSGGPDVHPARYGQAVDPRAGISTNTSLDDMECAILDEALRRDLPVLAICRGMQLLNVVFGGTLLQDIPNHQGMDGDAGQTATAYHRVFVSPGSKLGHIVGSGGNYRTNSRHHQGLREPQRARGLLASAYCPDDGIIEGLESPAHTWIIGVQCHPEREDEVPRSFSSLFDGLVYQAAIAQNA